MSSAIRLLLADQSLAREGLRCLFQAHAEMRVVGEADDSQAAFELLRACQADVMVLGIGLPGLGDAESLARLVNACANVRVLVVAQEFPDSLLHLLVSAGVSGCLRKDAWPSDLGRAVHALHAGLAWLPPQAQRYVLDRLRGANSTLDRLTGRERSVLVLLAEGHNNKAIARQLGLSEGTVKGYVSQVLAKLDVRDRMQAAMLARRETAWPAG